MKSIKRIDRKGLFILPMILVLLGVGYFFLLPRLFQLPAVQKKIRAVVSEETGGIITCEVGRVAVFPKPSILLSNVRLQNNGRYAGTIDQVWASPRPFSLLRGRFAIAAISLEDAHLTMALPEQATAPSLDTILELLGQYLEAGAQALAPAGKFTVDIGESALSLTRSGRPVFSLRDIKGALSWKRPGATLSLGATADLWDRCDIALRMDTTTRSFSGSFTAENLTPAAAWNSLFPDAALGLEVGTMDAKITWETENFETWHLSAGVRDPDITFRKAGKTFTVRGGRAAGEAVLNAAGLHIAISEMDLDSPGFSLTGELELNSEAPFAGWEINVESVDLASTREAAIFFAGRFKTTQRIAQVLREGRVPRITMGQRAQSAQGLKRLSSFYLDGELEKSTLFVPKAELSLTETSGRVTVTDGMLYATDLRTRLGDSTGTGKFTLGLDPNKPLNFKVDCDIAANMAQLPPLLERLIKNEPFSREMAGLSSVAGTAEGAMVIEKDSGGYGIEVNVSNFDFTATYHRLLFPVALSGGGFLYRKGEIQVEDLRGNVGDSDFSDITAAVSWEPALRMNIDSAQARVNAEEFTTWLGDTVPALRPVENGTTCTGHVVIADLQFDGPLLSPEEWRLQTHGNVMECITVGPPLLSEPLRIHSCRFEATQERIDLMDTDLSFLSARFATNASLTDYLNRGPWTLDILSVGRLDQAFCDWVIKENDIPEALKWHTPLVATPLALQWHEEGGVRIWGQAASESGLQLAFDIDKTEDALAVHRLALDSDGETATGSLVWDEEVVTVDFSGELTGHSLSALMADNQFLAGSIRGDFTARFDTTPPFLESFTGALQAHRLDITPAGLPLLVEHMELWGNGTATDIQSARFTWKGDTFSSSGRVKRSGQDLALDVTVEGGDVDWASIRALADTAQAQEETGDYAILGNIQFSCDRFSLGPELAFEPFQTRLTLGKDRIDIASQDAELCGISFPGTLTLTPDRGLFSFQPSAAGQSLEPTATCLRKGKVLMDGRYNLSGDLTFEWDRETPLLSALGGTADLTAQEGRIYKAVLLGKLFSLLNISDILSGQVPDLEKDGFSYKSAVFSGNFTNGQFELDSGVIDSSAMKIFFKGAEDLIHQEHDLTLVVAPLRTVDVVIEKIPVLSDVLEKGLVIYPIRVQGSWDDPELALLSPSAVGGEMLDLMGRTLKLPVTIFEKLFQSGKGVGE